MSDIDKWARRMVGTTLAYEEAMRLDVEARQELDAVLPEPGQIGEERVVGEYLGKVVIATAQFTSGAKETPRGPKTTNRHWIFKVVDKFDAQAPS